MALAGSTNAHATMTFMRQPTQFPVMAPCATALTMPTSTPGPAPYAKPTTADGTSATSSFRNDAAGMMGNSMKLSRMAIAHISAMVTSCLVLQRFVFWKFGPWFCAYVDMGRPPVSSIRTLTVGPGLPPEST